jgi:porphobilinogen synthase
MQTKEVDFPLPTERLRRLRTQPALRQLLTEHRLSAADLVFPLFIKEGLSEPTPIGSMPGQYQWPLAEVAAEAVRVHALGIPAVLLFGVPLHKDATGSSCLQSDSLIAQAVQAIKTAVPELLVITDLCFCEYTDHGHCGVISEQDIDNDATLELLVQQALVHAKAGADVIAPSGMMDGMIAALRTVLDREGFSHIPLLSYAVKYASSFYGPFREAAEGTPSFGDRKTHQMNPANASTALREAALDVEEGADMLMVKPAGAYLDVIYQLKQAFPGVPCAAYQVSGEYAMIQAAGERGWLDPQAAMMESLLAIKRAGADFIITYFAKQVAELLASQ